MKQGHRQPVRGTDRHKMRYTCWVASPLTGTNGTHTPRCVPCAGEQWVLRVFL